MKKGSFFSFLLSLLNINASENVFSNEALQKIVLKNPTEQVVCLDLFSAFNHKNPSSIAYPSEGWIFSCNGEEASSLRVLTTKEDDLYLPQKKAIIVQPHQDLFLEINNPHCFSGIIGCTFKWSVLYDQLIVELGVKETQGILRTLKTENAAHLFSFLDEQCDARYPFLHIDTPISIIEKAFFFIEENFYEFCMRPGYSAMPQSEDFKKLLQKEKTLKQSDVCSGNISGPFPASKQCAFFSMTKDEGDIIDGNLGWHYDVGFRIFLLIENGSTDETREKIDLFKSLFQEASVIVIKDDRIAYRQTSRSNAAFYLLGKICPSVNFVFPVDSDEFLVFDRPLDDLVQCMPNDTYWGYFPRLTYHPTSDFDFASSQPFYEKMTSLFFCSPYSSNVLLNPFSGKSFFKLRCQMLTVQGNHYAVQKSANVEKCFDLGIHMREYPMRSPEHVRKKVLNIGRAITKLYGHKNYLKHYADYRYERYLEEGDITFFKLFTEFMKNNPDRVEKLSLKEILEFYKRY